MKVRAALEWAPRRATLTERARCALTKCSAWFRARPKARADFAAFAVTDFGQTVQLGDYEASADAILYDLDPDARRRMKEREIKRDASFGGALRRLRSARGISRSDFAPLSAKTVARIERGEVDEPHGNTLATIAKRLEHRSA